MCLVRAGPPQTMFLSNSNFIRCRVWTQTVRHLGPSLIWLIQANKRQYQWDSTLYMPCTSPNEPVQDPLPSQASLYSKCFTHSTTLSFSYFSVTLLKSGWRMQTTFGRVGDRWNLISTGLGSQNWKRHSPRCHKGVSVTSHSGSALEPYPPLPQNINSKENKLSCI